MHAALGGMQQHTSGPSQRRSLVELEGRVVLVDRIICEVRIHAVQVVGSRRRVGLRAEAHLPIMGGGGPAALIFRGWRGAHEGWRGAQTEDLVFVA